MRPTTPTNNIHQRTAHGRRRPLLGLTALPRMPAESGVRAASPEPGGPLVIGTGDRT
jgi:hypothetical protein